MCRPRLLQWSTWDLHKDQCIEWFNKTVEENPYRIVAQSDPRFDSLRFRSSLDALLRRMKLSLEVIGPTHTHTHTHTGLTILKTQSGRRNTLKQATMTYCPATPSLEGFGL